MLKPAPVRIFGICNVTRDSFSDGGRALDPEAAGSHALALHAAGADFVDVGAESTHPDAEDVPDDEEIRRLAPVIEALHGVGARVSVDTWKPEVMADALARGVEVINDVRALRTPGAVEAVRDAEARIVLMHSVARAGRAGRDPAPPAGETVPRILAFFEERIATLTAGGIDRGRLILDPGMGFFLGDSPGPSLEVLAGLPRLAALGLPLLVSTSRKSFLGAVLDRPVAERGPATLATELHARRMGVDYVRTHDVAALVDAVRILDAIEGA